MPIESLTKGEAIALGTLIVAVLSCPVVLAVMGFNGLPLKPASATTNDRSQAGADHREPNDRQERIQADVKAAEKERLNEELQAEENAAEKERLKELANLRARAHAQEKVARQEKLLLARHERLLARDSLNDGTAASGNYHEVTFTNACAKEIVLAILYQDLQNEWLTRGWYRLAPSAVVTPSTYTGSSIKAQSRYIYFFAEAEGLEWNGKDENGSVERTIFPGEFMLIGDADGIDIYENKRQASFMRRDAGNSRHFAITLNCATKSLSLTK